MLGVLLLAGGLGAYALTRGTKTPVAHTAVCPSAAPSPAAQALPGPHQIRFTLLNGTSRQGLAAQVATALAARGFVVLRHDNAPAALPGATVVSYGQGAQDAAIVLASHLFGARVQADPHLGPGVLQAVLGSSFSRLATATEVTAAEHAARPAPTSPIVEPRATCHT